MSLITPLDRLDVTERRVFCRVDFNVPLTDEGGVADDFRIQAALPTIQDLLERRARVILASHLGRPKGKVVESLSLEPAAARLAELLDVEVLFTDDCVGDGVRKVVGDLRPGRLVVLENLRFHAGEEAGDKAFANQLAENADLYVSDAFGVLHRGHASVKALPESLRDRGMGYLVQREVEVLGKLMEAPDKPYVAILGGAKVSDKLELIRSLLKRVDCLCIGGAMAYTFLAAQDKPVGASRVERDKLWAAREIIENCEKRGVALVLPVDHIVAPSIDAEDQAKHVDGDIEDGWMGLDIGVRTRHKIADRIRSAGSVLWNGPMGVFEAKPFAEGTERVAREMAECAGTTVIGGGDSAAAARQFGYAEAMDHVSTGGGASLTFLAGNELPGLKALEAKSN